MNKMNKLPLLIILVLIFISSVVFMFKNEAKSLLIKTKLPEITSITTPDIQESKAIKNETQIEKQLGIITGTSITIDTSDWLTFKNGKYGYEIKYPRGSEFTTKKFIDGEHVSIDINMEGKLLSVLTERIIKELGFELFFRIEVEAREEDTENLSLKEWFYTYGPITGRQAPSPIFEKEIKINGHPALYLEYSGDSFGLDGYGAVFIYMLHDNNKYLIYVVKIPDPLPKYIENNPLLPYVKQYIPIVEAMIHGFKFLDYK